MTEIYVSTDVEADGPIPGRNWLLSFGSAAFRADGTMLGTYTANLATLPGTVADPDTMAWWAKNPDAWQACRSNPRDPGVVMSEYRGWLEGLPGKPVFVGYPAAYEQGHLWLAMRRAADSRATGTRAADCRAAGSRAVDSRATGTRAADCRAAGSRAADCRAADSRAAGSRAAQ